MIVNTLDHPIFYEAEVLTKTRETKESFTYCFGLLKKQLVTAWRFLPGQFNLLDIPGVGIHRSIITSDPLDQNTFEHTFQYHLQHPHEAKIVERIMEGSIVKVSGPFGNQWTRSNIQGKNLLIIANGFGLRSIKPMLNFIEHRRLLFNHVEVLYSAKTAKDFLFMDEYERWQENGKIDLKIIVENKPLNFQTKHRTGLIVGLLKEMKSTAEDTDVLIAAPEMTVQFAVNYLRRKQFTDQQVYISMDNRLNEPGYEWVGRHGTIFPLPEYVKWIGKQ